jgi:hypothetical protein
MVSIKRTKQTLALIALGLFVVSMVLKIGAGIGFRDALLDTSLSALQMVYSGISLSSANSSIVLASKVLDALILPILAVLLATIFAGALGNFSLTERISKGKMRKMKGQVIIVPFNRLGRELAQGLHEQKIPTVAMVKNMKELDEAAAAGIVGLVGDIDESDSFSAAGIRKASCVVACSHDDSVNAMIAMSARAVVPSMKVFSVVNDTENREKVKGIKFTGIVTPELEAARSLADGIIKNVFAKPDAKG